MWIEFKDGEAAKGITATIILLVVLGIVCMILAHHIWVTF